MTTAADSGDGYLSIDIRIAAGRQRGGAMDGKWKIYFDLPHVAFSERYEMLTAVAVCDDFGDLVVVADESGKVCLQ
jgi:hypothetical protein